MNNTKKRFHDNKRPVCAFTLIELVVVMGVIIALVATTLPAFKALQESNRAANGMNAVSAALSTARSIAVREARDTAVMFQFDITRQVTSMQILVMEKTIMDIGGLGPASMFVAMEGTAPIELPKGAGVYGYGYGATRMGNSKDLNSANWYIDLGKMDDYAGNEADPWVFPRTDPIFFAGDGDIKAIHVKFLDTFIVRFSPEGTVVTNAEELESLPGSGADSYIELDVPGLTGGGAYGKWDPRLESISGKDKVVAEVQFRSVPFLAVVDLYRIAEETGIRAPWMTIGNFDAAGPERLDSDGDGEMDQYEIDHWIKDQGAIVSFNRYSGEIMHDIRR